MNKVRIGVICKGCNHVHLLPIHKELKFVCNKCKATEYVVIK